MTPDARTIDFFDRHVSQMISEKYGFDEKEGDSRLPGVRNLQNADRPGAGYLHIEPHDRIRYVGMRENHRESKTFPVHQGGMT